MVESKILMYIYILVFLAYQALTVEESRHNWEKYGNPDGPGAMSFGIALPSWIVEKENSFWVCNCWCIVLVVGNPKLYNHCLCFFVAYKVTQFDHEYANFDTYEILGVALVGLMRNVVKPK